MNCGVHWLIGAVRSRYAVELLKLPEKFFDLALAFQLALYQSSSGTFAAIDRQQIRRHSSKSDVEDSSGCSSRFNRAIEPDSSGRSTRQ
ncbi:MAG: hypothetical protein F6K28_60570 [Microcoleus sp. SIO2G3]|nr:hypothetical protein [Microcoleus sp. SIO2G3]